MNATPIDWKTDDLALRGYLHGADQQLADEARIESERRTMLAGGAPKLEVREEEV